MKARPPPDWIELNAAAARLSGEWGLFPSEAERIVRKVALSGDVRIRATPQFESIFEFPKAERLDLVEGFLHSRAWRRLEIQWSELLEVGRDYSPYATPAPPKASTEDIREAIRAIINEWGYNPNTNELPPLVNDWLKTRVKKASWARIQQIGNETEFRGSRRPRGVTLAPKENQT